IPEISIFRLRGKNRAGDPTSALSCTAWGFSCDLVYTKARWALTPPFQPCPAPFLSVVAFSISQFRRAQKCVRSGIFSVILSVIWSFRPKSPRFSRGMLPCGVRTFLWYNKGCASDHPSHLHLYHGFPDASGLKCANFPVLFSREIAGYGFREKCLA